MKRLTKKLARIKKKGTVIQISLTNTIETQKILVGTIKGVRKDYFLLNLFSFPALSPTGKIAAIKLEQVETVQDVEASVDKINPADSQPDHELIAISIPLPVRIKILDSDFTLEVPRIRLATASQLTKTKSTEILTELSGLLRRIGKSNDEVLV